MEAWKAICSLHGSGIVAINSSSSETAELSARPFATIGYVAATVAITSFSAPLLLLAGGYMRNCTVEIWLYVLLSCYIIEYLKTLVSSLPRLFTIATYRQVWANIRHWLPRYIYTVCTTLPRRIFDPRRGLL